MAAPLPESRASTMSTLAPSVMSASAWVCMVLALPWALSTLKSLAVRPAALNAFVRYGASKVTYRVDVVVSGSNTPILPFPCAASDLSCAMAEKSLVNEDAETEATAAVVGVDAPVFVFFDELQVDRPIPNKATADKALTRRSERLTVPPLPTVRSG